jgi:hypothetical protein
MTVLVVAVASAAWAVAWVVQRGHPIAARATTHDDAAGPPARPPATPRLPPSTPPQPAVIASPPPPRRHKTTKTAQKPPTSPLRPVELERPEGDIILAAPHEKQPPLFSPEQWKRQHAGQGD